MKAKYLIIWLLTFLLFVPYVKAENGIVTAASGINMRENPTTESRILLAIAKDKNFYIVNLSAGIENGCSDSWYYIYYGSQYGYICSSYVNVINDNITTSTTYDRPWTSPKKAIFGGAKFISNSYISKGQFTSYLKKFNVNPEAYYSVYNHQYMANLRAPSSEAYTSYRSLRDNGLLNNAYNFVIPVYLEMPTSTYDITIKNTDINTAEIQEEPFEQSITLFPDSYKPYLRYLHTIHANWTFTPLNTGLDFNNSYIMEKNVSSIEISSGFCERSPYTVTESGWCIGNESATKFFLDPRNFLSEKYIFMFENLAYSSLFTVETIQSILNGTFMEALSIIDNQNYASIFVEAGLNANVSPLYLASLAIQEVSSNGSMATSGKLFEYDGFVYYNLYNFFNIGANSGADNPVKAGLVYANGGAGINNGANLDATSVNFLTILQVGLTGTYIKGYNLGTTISAIKAKVGTQAIVQVRDQSGTIRLDNEVIGTGYKININNQSKEMTYTYVMKGDINGDGEINSADLLKIRQHLLGTNILTNSYLTSAYITDDTEVNSADLLKIRQYLLGKVTINQ